MRIRLRILLFIKVIKICDHWSTEPPEGSVVTLHASIVSVHGPPRLHFEPLKRLNFDFDADPDPDFHSNVEPDPASQNNADQDPKP
jgi:hypothetical protein